MRGFDRPFGLPPAAGASLEAAEFEDGTYRLRFSRPVSLGKAPLALSYHPWLAVRNDGGDKDGDELRTKDAGDQLAVTEPAVTKELTVSYEPPGWVRGSWIVSVLGLLGLGVLLGERRRITTWLKGRVPARGRRKRRTGSRR